MFLQLRKLLLLLSNAHLVMIAVGDHQELCQEPPPFSSPKHHQLGPTMEDEACLRPLTPDEALCGTTSDAELRCHTMRAGRNFHSYRGWWLNVCLFVVDDPSPTYMEMYECKVMLRYYNKVRCTKKADPQSSYMRACNFTFHYCPEEDPMECVKAFPSVLEDGGSCEADDDWCPSSGLYSLTNVIRCDNMTNVIQRPDFKYLTALDIRPPARCVNTLSVLEEVVLAVGVLFILIGIIIGVWWYRKVIRKNQQKDNTDSVIQTVESVLSGPQPMLRFRANSSFETAEPFTGTKLLVRDGSDHSSRDTGFESVCLADLLSVVEEDEVLDTVKEEPVPPYMRKCSTPPSEHSTTGQEFQSCGISPTGTCSSGHLHDFFPITDTLKSPLVVDSLEDCPSCSVPSLHDAEQPGGPDGSDFSDGSEFFVQTYTTQRSAPEIAISGYSKKTDFA